MLLSFLTRMFAPSTKVIGLKSTSFWRPSVLVVTPHSISTLPLLTAAKRSWAFTGTHLTVISFAPRSRRTASATAMHRSIE